MKCVIREKEQSKVYSVGEPKEIIVDKREWSKDGHQGFTYSYHMSKERFERENRTIYDVYIETEEEDGTQEAVKLGTMGYYDLADFGYEDCIGERIIENAAKELKVEASAVQKLIEVPLKELEKKVEADFAATEEAKAKKEHEEVLQKYHKARRDFSMQYGFNPVEYDRCYNVFGQLMDAEYLSHLKDILAEREKMKHHSRRYRKEESQKRFHQYLHESSSTEYDADEQVMLAKFYKLLAKKYHPDANPGVDTSEEMTLLNKLKKQWNV